MTDAPDAGAPTRPPPAKGPAAFRTISEAAAEVGVPQHVLRFWETRFAFIRPTKRAGGRRFYRPQDLEVLRGVRALLQDEGYTIKGVQKLHKEQGLKRLLAAAGVAEAAAAGLAAEVVARTGEEPDDDMDVPPPPVIEDDEPQTGDLFGAASASSTTAMPRDVPPPRPEPPPPPPEPKAARPVLDAAARTRLAEVLEDLEATKAEIDALLGTG